MKSRAIRLALFGFGSIAASCAPPDAEPVADSPAAAPAMPPRDAPSPGNWATELGRFLVLPAETESLAIVLLPDPASPPTFSGSRITLVNSAGDTASVSAYLDTLQCGDAPVLRLGDGVLSGWRIGLQDPSAQPIRMDSLEGMSRADSARVTTALARLGSKVNAHAQPEFKGLPFAVARARRFSLDGRVVVVAHLVRRVPQEAAPLEEHTFIIAERPTTGGAFEIAYSQHSEGTEESAEHYEALAAVRGHDGVMLVLARDRMLQSTYQVLKRSARGKWTVRWTRTFRC